MPVIVANRARCEIDKSKVVSITYDATDYPEASDWDNAFRYCGLKI